MNISNNIFILQISLLRNWNARVELRKAKKHLALTHQKKADGITLEKYRENGIKPTNVGYHG